MPSIINFHWSFFQICWPNNISVFFFYYFHPSTPPPFLPSLSLTFLTAPRSIPKLLAFAYLIPGGRISNLILLKFFFPNTSKNLQHKNLWTCEILQEHVRFFDVWKFIGCFFLVPITARHVFLKKIIFHCYI